jgi:hypothetical protein
MGFGEWPTNAGGAPDTVAKSALEQRGELITQLTALQDELENLPKIQKKSFSPTSATETNAAAETVERARLIREKMWELLPSLEKTGDIVPIDFYQAVMKQDSPDRATVDGLLGTKFVPTQKNNEGMMDDTDWEWLIDNNKQLTDQLKRNGNRVLGIRGRREDPMDFRGIPIEYVLKKATETTPEQAADVQSV